MALGNQRFKTPNSPGQGVPLSRWATNGIGPGARLDRLLNWPGPAAKVAWSFACIHSLQPGYRQSIIIAFGTKKVQQGGRNRGWQYQPELASMRPFPTQCAPARVFFLCKSKIPGNKREHSNNGASYL